MNCARRSLLLVMGIAMAVTLHSSPAAAQVAIGPQPFGSFGGGPDVINLGNLNVHYTIPVRHKVGRGNNFAWDLQYDSSIWTPVGTVGSQVWNPVSTLGWQGLNPAGQSYVTYSMIYNSGQCGYRGQSNYQVWNYGNFVYVDQFGRSTYFNDGISYYSSPGGNTCPPNGPQPPTVYPVSANGYTLYAAPGAGYVSGNVVDQSGTSFNPPFGTSPPAQQGAYVWSVDHNSNSISVNNGVFTDTLNQTALSIVQATNTNLFYTAPSGATANYAVSYKTYVVRTNFGCSHITEYNASRISQFNLVDRVTLPDGSFYQFNYETTYQDTHTPHDVTGRIASVILPTGGTISYQYASGGTGVNGISCSDGTATTLVRTTPDTVSNSWTYARTLVAGAHWQTTITDPTANQAVVDFQEDTTSTGNFYETQRKIYQGSTSGTLLETLTTCYNTNTSNCTTTAVGSPISQLNVTTQLGTSDLQSLGISTYNGNGLLSEEDDYDYAHGTPTTILKKTLITYASLGNIVDMPATVTICSATGTSSSCNGSGTPVAQTTYTYDGVAVTPSSGTPQHNCASNGCYGNVTTIAQLIQGSTILNQTYTYYDTGMMNTFTDVNGAVTTFNYLDANSTCGNAFPTSITEPVSNMSRSATWNCAGGVQLTSTDENGRTTTLTYANDKYYWRLDSVSDPTNASVNFCYGLLSNSTGTCTLNLTQGESTLNFSSNNSTVDTLTTLDGLGRTHVQQKRQSPTATTFDSAEADYDALGHLSRTTLPYSGTSGQTNSSAPAVTTTYDALGRRHTVTDAGGGTTTYSYSENDVLVTVSPAPTGENTKQRQLEYDGLGRLTSVCEITVGTTAWPPASCGQNNSATGYLTKYTYDALGDLLTVTQNAQSTSNRQTRGYAYDAMSRLTSETNPESGTTTYIYDSDSTGNCTWPGTSYYGSIFTGTYSGDLVRKVDYAGNQTCFQYDALHRLTGEIHPYGPYYCARGAGSPCTSPDQYFVYDAATVNGTNMTNAKARLAEAYTCAGACSSKITDEGFSYTARAEVSDVYEMTPHSSPSYYHISETYWPHGAPSQLSSGISGLPTINYGGPIGSTVGLDGEGRITQVTASGAGQQNPVTGVTYNNSSLPTQINLGSGDSDIFAYDSYTLRMTQFKFNVGTQSQSLTGSLTWNANSTLGQLAITDQFNSTDTQTCNYSHDDLVRIVSANCGSAAAQTFSYDPFGNISKSGSPYQFLPTYSAATNRFASLPGNFTPTYDANGNVTNDSNHTYSWDVDGNSITIDSVGLTFDAFDRMVEQNRSGTYTEIVYSPTFGKLALMSGTGGQTLQKAFVPLPGRDTAIYTSSGLDHYRHSDWLGSARLTSTTARAVASTAAYAPFGEAYAQTGSADLSFTGQNQDTLSGNSGDYDFLDREYSTEGRWPSPDPAGLGAVNSKNPQSWNRYAYVLNNPLGLTDPLGLWCVWQDGTHDDTVSDGGIGEQGCIAAGGLWDPTNTITGCNSSWNCSLSDGTTISAAALCGGLYGCTLNATDSVTVSADACGPAPTGFGVLAIAGANGAIGVGKASAQVQGSAGGGVFFNSRDQVNAGIEASGGASARWGKQVAGAPKQSDPPIVAGAYAGYGPGIMFTNAGSAKQLSGPFQTLTIDLGVGMGKGSIQIANSGNIWTVSFTGGPAPVSAGLGFDINYSTTTTIATGTNNCP